jgi:hypothetical protein
MERMIRLRRSAEEVREEKGKGGSFFRAHPVDWLVLLYLVFGLPVSLKFLPSPVALFLLVGVIFGWVYWKRTR